MPAARSSLDRIEKFDTLVRKAATMDGRQQHRGDERYTADPEHDTEHMHDTSGDGSVHDRATTAGELTRPAP